MPDDRKLNRADTKWGHPDMVSAGVFLLPGDAAAAFRAMEGKGPEECDSFQEANNVKPMIDLYVASKSPGWDDCTWDEYRSDSCVIDGLETGPVRMLVRTPNDVGRDELLPVIFSIPGGGMAGCGTPETGMVFASRLIVDHGIRAIWLSMQYHLAPGYQYPTNINDIESAYLWMLEHARELHIDTDRIVIEGSSTGGHLALCTGFRLKRHGWCGGPKPRGIVSCVPIMDDTCMSQSGRFSFKREDGSFASIDPEVLFPYRWWLGDRFADPSLSPEAIPNRATATDVMGYPPVWFPMLGEFDVGRDSAYKFARLLHEAGVFCDLHMWGGTNHAMCNAGGSLGERIWHVYAGCVRDALTHDFRRSWLDQ